DQALARRHRELAARAREAERMAALARPGPRAHQAAAGRAPAPEGTVLPAHPLPHLGKQTEDQLVLRARAGNDPGDRMLRVDVDGGAAPPADVVEQGGVVVAVTRFAEAHRQLDRDLVALSVQPLGLDPLTDREPVPRAAEALQGAEVGLAVADRDDRLRES